jgi:GNAT superfamily N-acetyltransferase
MRCSRTEAGRDLHLACIARAVEVRDGLRKLDHRFAPIPPGIDTPGVEPTWVCPEYRRRGIAAELLRTIAEYHRTRPDQLSYLR